MYIQAFATVKCDREVAYSRTQHSQHIFVLCAIYIVYTVYSAAQKFVNSEQKMLFLKWPNVCSQWLNPNEILLYLSSGYSAVKEH